MDYTFIYILTDPTTGEVRYVGKTNSTRRRLYSHINECKGNKTSHKINWIKSLLENDKSPLIAIIDKVDISEWQFWESFWIEQFKQWGCRLTNLTKGGDGGLGYKHTISAKKKMRKSKLGISLSEEHKTKISKSVKEDWDNNPREVDKSIILSKEDLYQKYIVENLSMPKLSKFFGCSKKTIFNNLKDNNISKDKEVWREQLSTNPKKPVLQYDLEGNLIREWDCASEIEKEFGYKPGNIASCCRGLSITANGFIWRYKDDFIEIDLEKLNYQKRKVKQYDMKGNFIKSYDSIKEAAGIGFNEGNIQDCCVGRSKSHRGYMWRYAEDSAPEKYKKKQQRRVSQHEMNGDLIRIWESIVDATKELGIGGNCISTCCKGKYKSAGGFVWKYCE
jgi:group I intron endonuclease